MIKKIMMLSLGFLIFHPDTFAEDCQWHTKSYTDKRPIPRAFFASALDYHHDTESNDFYIHGGIGPDGATMDSNGALWFTSLQNDGIWTPINPEACFDIPPARSYMDGAMIPQNWPALNSATVKRFLHFATFGGLESSGNPTDAFWICTKVFTDEARFGSKYHWRWTGVDQSGDTPCARAKHRMIYIPPTGDDPFPYVFMLGGIDENGESLGDAYLGKITFTIADSTTGNPWEYSISVECEWDQINADLRYTGVTGESVVYDPFYGPERHPRVLIYGGFTPKGSITDAIVAYDLTDREWIPIVPEGVFVPDARADHACALDPRELRLVVHGGRDRDEENAALNDLLFFDLTTLLWSSSTVTGSPYRYGHGAAYYWFTIFGGISDDGHLMDDVREYKSDAPFKEWTITPEAEYGLDDPASVLETPRIKGGDWVRIHSGGVDHFYQCRFIIPYYIGHITVEGVSHDGYKPAIFWPCSAVGPNVTQNEFLIGDDPLNAAIADYFRFGSSSYVIRDGAGITLRNLRIGHFDEVPGDPIPDAVLDDLETVQTSNGLLLRDPGIVMNAPTQVEDCEFEGNIDGITMICVSTIPGFQEASVTGSLFHENYIGCVVLETSHEFESNTVKNNYLAGVMLEKGAHGRVHDNLFVGNGFEEDVAFQTWRSDVLCSFDVTTSVPHVQTPLIHNNTFIESYRTLSVYQYTHGAQYLNCPVFMNNIIYSPDQGYQCAIFFYPKDTCQYRSQNNVYYCNSNWLTEPDRSLLSNNDRGNIAPLFASPSSGNYKLNSSSPCINAGYDSLQPGISSEGDYLDYHLLDTGYHFPNSTSGMSPVTNVTSAGGVISWTPPTPSPAGYVVVWDDGSGYILGSANLISSATSYTVPTELRGIGLYFGISAFSSSGQFSSPVFIQM